MRLINLFSSLVLLLLLDSCTRTNDNHDPTATSVNGTLYVSSRDSIAALDLQTNMLKFKVSTFTATGTYETAINYDSGYIYKGSQYGMVSYNASNGSWRWRYSYGIGFISGSAPPVLAQKAIFVDSVMYFISSFPFSGSSLFCMNKKTGAVIWKATVSGYDLASLSDEIPAISGDRIFVSGRDPDDDEYFHCFNRFTGLKLWTKYLADRHSGQKVEVYNGTVISYGRVISCMNISDGSIRWQIEPLPTYSREYFLEPDRALMLVSSNNSTQIHWLNKSNGTMTPGPTFAKQYTRSIYKNRKLYLLYGSDPVVTLKAFNTDDGSQIWSCTIPGPYGTWQTTSLYFTMMVSTDNEIIFGENLDISPSRKARFNVINLSTGSYQEIIPPLPSLNRYLTIIKDDKVYSAEN